MSKSNAQVKIPVMLVSPNKEIGRIQFPCFAQTKMDGMRGVIVKRDGRVVVFSRNGNTMTKLDKHFEAALSSVDNVVIDGELTVVDSDGKLLDRKTGNGILNKTVVETVSDEEVSRVVFTAWDLIDVCDFDKGIDRRTGVERLARLRAIPKLFDVESGTQLFRIVETFEVANLEEAQQLFKEQLAKGEEGIILKNNDHPWEDKRSKQCVKMKEVIEMDLKITGFVEGTGKASGMTGAIQVENKDGSIKTNVGTGLDDATRKDIWARQEELIGTIITVKCNGVISRKGADSKSLFLPVFVELRLDKTESD
jgi:DNA ligase-1